ncbi:hypothetical protein OS965_02425 [Streptomyces sp. H27-G5]|uniref:hypothetical protein n=1 Tax=Streptomyces sp. H27-G5 TaxID=2996698 RepID=UPI00226EBF98|nr:hypothetical protein [Streptomyces sp. H27-G5]MCY0917032.1 hypothetical protein [Streptomyces sp. H27-G5]
MNAKARTARRIVQQRTRANRDARRPHTLASHLLNRGANASDASCVAGALRSKAKTLGVTGSRSLVCKTSAGKLPKRAPKRPCIRYTDRQFFTLLTAYNPRAARFVAIRANLLLAV